MPDTSTHSGWSVSVHRSDRDGAWDAFVASVPGGHHVQTSFWSRVKARQGWEPVRVTARSGDRILAGAQILTRSIRGLGRIGYLERGPLVAASAPELGQGIVAAIQDVARSRHIQVLVVRPPEGRDDIAAALEESGFGPCHVKVSLGATVLVDLSPDLDSILAQMKSKTRYNIRKGMRSPLTVRVATSADLPRFSELLAGTARRQGFVPDSLATITELFHTLSEEGAIEILLAEVESRPVAGIMTVRYGDRVVYKRGAWGGTHGSMHPNERLHWEAMRRAREAGFRYYDFDGIEPDVARKVRAGEDLPPDARDSVTRFKLGFGGEVVLLPDSCAYLPNPALRWGHDVVFPRVARSRYVKRAVKRLRPG